MTNCGQDRALGQCSFLLVPRCSVLYVSLQGCSLFSHYAPPSLGEARRPWVWNACPGSKSRTPPHTTPTSSVCNELRRAQSVPLASNLMTNALNRVPFKQRSFHGSVLAILLKPSRTVRSALMSGCGCSTRPSSRTPGASFVLSPRSAFIVSACFCSCATMSA